MNQETLQKAIKSTYENAQRFLRDSEILHKKGSLGHAASLAILGYEEAMKAFELTKFHPVFEGIYPEAELLSLKEQLRSHQWKQNSAIGLRVGVEALIHSDAISEIERVEMGFPSVEELQQGTDFALSEKLDSLKNDGLYVDAFRNPFWSPFTTTEVTVKFTQLLLKTQLKTVGKVVEQLTSIDGLSNQVLAPIKIELKEVVALLEQAQKEGVKELDELENRLSKHNGIIGKFALSLAKAYVGDSRFKTINKERRKRKLNY
jgi:AbiV family abortive infection protein